jgi:hypothetical protein
MKRIITLSAIVVLLMFIVISCEKTIEFDDSEVNPMLVVYSYIHSDSIIVDVTRSYSSLEDNDYYYTPIKDAFITISDGTNSYTDFTYNTKTSYSYMSDKYGNYALTAVESGHYSIYDIDVTPGKTYTITVSADGYETIYSEVTMPSSVNINEVDTISRTSEEDGYTSIEQGFVIKLADPAGEENYYQIRLEEAMYQLYIDTLTKEANYYAYVSNTWGTIDNESSDLEYDSDILYTYEEDENCFSDDLNDGKTLNIKFDLGTDTYWSDNSYKSPYNEYKLTLYKVKLLSISKSMYNYIRTSSTQSWYEDDPFAEPVLVYNNIKNGAGNFGAYSIDHKFVMFGTVPDEIKAMLPAYSSNEELWNILEEIADSI